MAMMNSSLPTVQADLVLVHAPASFDFRDRGDIYYPYLSTSGDVPITPLYEYFPIGFKALQRHLTQRGYDVKIINLSTVFLRYPNLDASVLLRAIDAKLFGIDLHWMVHVQGSLKIAELLKTVHPDVPVVFGGISSTYFARQLIEYPFVDMVMRGYDTLATTEALLASLRTGHGFERVENLLWKNHQGEVVDNGLTYLPRTYSCGVDWSSERPRRAVRGLAILEVLSTQNAGCAYNCDWCGGSRDAFRRIYGTSAGEPAMARKPAGEVAYELTTMRSLPNPQRYHFYSVGSYNESKSSLKQFLDQVGAIGLKSISYEQFHLTSDDVLEQMAAANPRTTITLSPESHDLRIATLAGRGVYTPEQMERWIERALDLGIYAVDIWYFIGMPEQDEASVWATVDYCHRLLKIFKGKRVTPLLCPMIPFLDPASTFFEHPEKHGYRVFYRSVEEHRRGMERASLINRTNYETDWLRRADLTFVGYAAVKRLAQFKGELGVFPSPILEDVIRRIDDAVEFMGVVHEIDCLPEKERERELSRVSADIRRRNDQVFFTGVANQAFPLNREIGGRWFDETLFDDAELAALCDVSTRTPAAPSSTAASTV